MLHLSTATEAGDVAGQSSQKAGREMRSEKGCVLGESVTQVRVPRSHRQTSEDPFDSQLAGGTSAGTPAATGFAGAVRHQRRVRRVNLTGGGARGGAYQAGILKRIGETKRVPFNSTEIYSNGSSLTFSAVWEKAILQTCKPSFQMVRSRWAW